MPPHERPSVAGYRQPTVARVVNKLPLTPKVAARPPAPQHQNPTLATPLARRPAPEPALNPRGSGSRDKDERASPVPTFLSSNVTPRSGSRQSRVDSANSTPNGTPNPDRHDHWETRSGVGVAGSGPDESHRRPVVTFSSPSEVGSGANPDRDSKFFYASDAQKQPPQAANLKPSVMQQPKPATFFYANGNALPNRQDPPPKPYSPALPSPSSQDSLATKFVYANGTPELQPPAKIGPSSQSSSASVLSTSSRLPAARQGNLPRAPSPAKSPSQILVRSPSSSTARSQRSPILVANPSSNPQASEMKANTEPQPRPAVSHTRSQSAAAIEPPAAAKPAPSHNSVPPSGCTSPSFPPYSELMVPNNSAAAGSASLLPASEDSAEPEEAQPDSLNSPTRASQDGQVIDLVASARRERKVQDLEITNASLEAINRTLERQLRKQTAELRRYQRLSRSGRLSLGSIGSRIPSDSTVDGGALARAGMGLDDLSEEESEIEAEDAELEELEDLGEDDMSGSEASSELSSGADALRRQKRRRDERRLQLDLSKHQQLLIDSQKINQSLKRCLGWTEELIKDGMRALAYQVRVSDVKLGGRVLAPEEIERRELGGDDGEDATLGDDTIYAIDALGGGSLLAEAAEPAKWSKDPQDNPQDRDSGVELPADGG
ncbi:uncharacterized protein THITE_2116915 [Thermothielavioides terrestris NRRL 8126]|uniref:Uncharacterized protein n=1 Tax=Thermothielavioides terrestris (strain ATCC 38088 / NRRL 8126) TaxID=578455 RepID=G2R7A6_THETT|nr:uncharacterized protein THITE_2116915 [Thermothielavioides terrestris NRRL 8126]AEO67815.1 hypothetical protein THITE_2116915 [Thermothielavioides terrestris NRRL 8126]